ARMVLNFAVEILRKRLLSSPVAFADTWLRFKNGLAATERTNQREVLAARSSIMADLDDDVELESRSQHAVKVVGAWMHPFVEDLSDEITKVDSCLANLGLAALPVTETKPKRDARFEHLENLIDRRLRNAGEWKDDERLIIFTE